MAPYAFHPEYSTANPRGNTWSAHTYNVAMSDEIGHFENCLKLDANFNCVKPGAQDKGSLDEDDGNNFCVPASDSTPDPDQRVLQRGRGLGRAVLPAGLARNRPERPPGSGPAPVAGSVHESAHERPYELLHDRVRDRSAADRGVGLQDNPPFCDRTTGANCVNPPNGAQFYPSSRRGCNGTCTWQEGGPFIPGTTNNFGGSSTAEFGPLLKTVYPWRGLMVRRRPR